MILYKHDLPTRSPVISVTCIEPDGREYRHFLSAREFGTLLKVEIVWDGVPTTLSLRHCHQGLSINDAAVALMQTAAADDRAGFGKAFSPRGPVFVGGHRTWFYNFAAVGKERDVANRIDHDCLRGEVRTSFIGWNFESGFVPMSCVSCESLADFTFLKMMLSG
jgi:hypothetical protein